MIEIDLVTGFLGAGKTTFIKKYVEYLTGCGYRVGIIENDFGAVNVDMLMLQDVLGDQCDVEQIVGGQVVADWKRRFRTKLISMAMRGFQRIIVEPSGIYDVDAFFDVLYDEPVDSWYVAGNIFTIVDVGLEEDLSLQEEYLLVSQVANTGRVILSKVEKANSLREDSVREHLNELMQKFKCDRRLQKEDMLGKNWDLLAEEDFKDLMSCHYKKADHEKLWFDQNKAFTSLFFMRVHMTEENLRQTVTKIFEDEACKTVFRIKGYVPTEDGNWLQINATKEHCILKPVERGQEIVIVIGQGMEEANIRAYWEEFIHEEN